MLVISKPASAIVCFLLVSTFGINLEPSNQSTEVCQAPSSSLIQTKVEPSKNNGQQPKKTCGGPEEEKKDKDVWQHLGPEASKETKDGVTTVYDSYNNHPLVFGMGDIKNDEEFSDDHAAKWAYHDFLVDHFMPYDGAFDDELLEGEADFLRAFDLAAFLDAARDERQDLHVGDYGAQIKAALEKDDADILRDWANWAVLHRFFTGIGNDEAEAWGAKHGGPAGTDMWLWKIDAGNKKQTLARDAYKALAKDKAEQERAIAKGRLLFWGADDAAVIEAKIAEARAKVF